MEEWQKSCDFTNKNGGTYKIATEAVSFKLILGGSMSVFMDVHRCMMVHFHSELFSGIPTRKPARWPAGITILTSSGGTTCVRPKTVAVKMRHVFKKSMSNMFKSVLTMSISI